MKNFHLAQINIAHGIADLEDPAMKDFADAIDHINELAESSEGFVWRLQTEDGDATAIQLFEDSKIIVNMSVWDSIDSLKNYVYKSGHLDILKRKDEWFHKPKTAHLALWWIPEGHIPSLEEAKEKLALIDEKGFSSNAFNFAKPFAPPA